MVAKLFLLLCTYNMIMKSLQLSEERRFGNFKLTNNHALSGDSLRRQRSYDLMACAKVCLEERGCVAFNYDTAGENGWCEIKNHGAKPGVAEGHLIQRLGYIFGQLEKENESRIFLARMTTHGSDNMVSRFAESLSKAQISEINENAIPINEKKAMKFGLGVFQDGPIYTFTTLGAWGPAGPTDTAAYAGTTLEGEVKLGGGIQLWTIPLTGKCVIEAVGASGANGSCSRANCSGWTLGGLGASITGTFELAEGDQLKILVGQEGGKPSANFADLPGGGGGGTFVTKDGDTLPLVVAGGGGGGGLTLPGYGNGDPGQAGRDGTRQGGVGGAGGKLYNEELGMATDILGGSGAGFDGDGESFFVGSFAKSFKNGGSGGSIVIGARINGGFGGGGYALAHPGGGGGYSGGGVTGTKSSGFAGGGGSYNRGSDQENKEGVNRGDGRVVIQMV